MSETSDPSEEARDALPGAEIIRRVDDTTDLFRIWLRPDAPFHFLPGQYATIGVGGVERPYSIVSAPFERDLEFFVESVTREHGGRLSPRLHAAQAGDRVTIRPAARGRFLLDAGVENHVMVATVTGIAPFVSMIRQFVATRETAPAAQFFVMHGASHQDEFVYDAELRQLSARFANIRYRSAVSRPLAPRNAGWTGEVGRINTLVESRLKEWQLAADRTVVYLCGNPGMIEDLRARLSPAGWRVLFERFWASDE